MSPRRPGLLGPVGLALVALALAFVLTGVVLGAMPGPVEAAKPLARG